MSMREKVRDSIELDPRLKQLGEDKLAEWRNWFDSRLDDAIEAAATQENPEIESEFCFVFVKHLHCYPSPGTHLIQE